MRVALSDNPLIIQHLAELGRTLAAGEILQLSNISNQEISEDIYYQVIDKKTAVLFEACAGLGAISVGVAEEDVEKAKKFGHNIGMIFQIRDDIFDYYDSKEIGKPTGNDMSEGKLTLPVIYALKLERLMLMKSPFLLNLRNRMGESNMPNKRWKNLLKKLRNILTNP